MDTRSDEIIFAAHIAGEPRAFDVLTARYLVPIYNFVHLYVRDDGDAEDVTQDVFVRAWAHAHTFDVKKRFKPWLFAIAKNTALNWLKKKKPLLFTDLERDDAHDSVVEYMQDDAPFPEELLIRKDIATMLDRAMSVLTPSSKAVVVLHHTEEFTFKEIAEMHGESIDTVKSRYRRALLQLRKVLARP